MTIVRTVGVMLLALIVALSAYIVLADLWRIVA